MMIQKKGIKLSEIGVEEYIKECTNYALEQVEIQQKQFERLALFTDFNQKYLTLMPKFESKQIGIFFKMLNKGLVYRDLKPVY
ncbi:MAG: hypothetical protein DRP42_02060 [Tenericutes bacterium]|nr:MAG: hypothetical protein DRP42_02060 [Mycoplasmatota bacterium]